MLKSCYYNNILCLIVLRNKQQSIEIVNKIKAITYHFNRKVTLLKKSEWRLSDEIDKAQIFTIVSFLQVK